jgi:hypothetical protein
MYQAPPALSAPTSRDATSGSDADGTCSSDSQAQDAVELPVPPHIVEAHVADGGSVADAGAGEPHHFLGGIERDDLVAALSESHSITPRPTASI